MRQTHGSAYTEHSGGGSTSWLGRTGHGLTLITLQVRSKRRRLVRGIRSTVMILLGPTVSEHCVIEKDSADIAVS